MSDIDDIAGEPGSDPQGNDPQGSDLQGGGTEVGYKKPPKAHQFKPGNKQGKGRPKGAKNIATIVKQSLGMKVSAKIGGKAIKASKIEIAMHQLANQASSGNFKAMAKAFELHERYGPQEDPEGPSQEEINLDLDSLRDFLRFQPGSGEISGKADNG